MEDDILSKQVEVITRLETAVGILLSSAQKLIDGYEVISKRLGDTEALQHIPKTGNVLLFKAELLELLRDLRRASEDASSETAAALAPTVSKLASRLDGFAKRFDKELKEFNSLASKVSKIGTKGREMKGFGEWLNESKLGLTDIIMLRERTRELGGWKGIEKSDKIGDYITVLQNVQCTQKVATIDALYKLWSLYESQERRKASVTSPTGWAVITIAILILIFYWLRIIQIEH